MGLEGIGQKYNCNKLKITMNIKEGIHMLKKWQR